MNHAGCQPRRKLKRFAAGSDDRGGRSAVSVGAAGAEPTRAVNGLLESPPACLRADGRGPASSAGATRDGLHLLLTVCAAGLHNRTEESSLRTTEEDRLSLHRLFSTTRGSASFLAGLLLAAVSALPAAGFFPPVEPGIPNRPAILLETNFYVFASALGLTEPDLDLTFDAKGYTSPSTVYLYWENRATEARMHYSQAANGFGGAETDVFGRAVDVSDLGSLLGAGANAFRLFGSGGALGALPSSVPRATGLYQFVLEIRDEAGEKVIARGNAMYSHVDAVVHKVGAITSSETWTSNNAYYLNGPTFIDGGATLTIQAGAVVYGGNVNQGVLVVKPGAKIMAVGTARMPIVLTSEFDVGEREPGDWGGLVISGAAPCNTCPREGEGDSGLFGGDNPTDSSGRLSFVRVEFAGIRFTDQNELNGIALQGVGSGTRIDHVQVHHNADDGIEFFGGTADAKYVLITDAQDDSIDWTYGWRGRMQHAVVLQRFDDHDKGIEADNNSRNHNLEPRSNPTIFNLTISMRRDSGDPGILLRRGAAITLRNAIVMNARDYAVDVDGDVSEGLVGNLLTIDNSIFFDNRNGFSNVDLMASNITAADPLLPDSRNRIQPDLAPLVGSPARSGAAPAPVAGDGFFDSVDYIGGVSPDDPWVDDGWTTFSDN